MGAATYLTVTDREVSFRDMAPAVKKEHGSSIHARETFFKFDLEAAYNQGAIWRPESTSAISFANRSFKATPQKLI